MRAVPQVSIHASSPLALVFAQQLVALLRHPHFDLHNDAHCKCVDALWHGALLARRTVQP